MDAFHADLSARVDRFRAAISQSADALLGQSQEHEGPSDTPPDRHSTGQRRLEVRNLRWHVQYMHGSNVDHKLC